MGKKKEKKPVEDEAEDWCFICKDGGSLLICDHKGCRKAYHPKCVGKKKSILKSEGRWTCCRHSCSECRATPQVYCLCCPKAVCDLCVKRAEFLCFKFEKGLCKDCLNRAIDAGQHAKSDSEEVEIDCEDSERDELMFQEYLEIVMKQEGLTFDDLHCAQLKRENHGSRSDLDKIEGKDSVLVISVSAGDSNKDSVSVDNSCGKRKKSEVCNIDFAAMDNSSDKTNKSEVREYVGWGSKPLIDFLKSVGKDVTKKLSKLEVYVTISKYILEKNLFHEEKKNIVVFRDEKLDSIFQKKEMHWDEMINHLDEHFVDTLGQTNAVENEDDRGSCPGNEVKQIMAERKRHRSLSPDNVPLEEKVSYEVPKSSYASIVAENIKLVYLRRSLVEELLMHPDNLENKVVGSFVRVKAKSGNCSEKSSFHLQQVTGIKKTLNAKIGRGVLLEVSCMPSAIPINMLDDDDISEEECVDLRQRMKDGLLRKPTVAELEQKAKSLHEDITKNWIEREMVRLQKKIDFAHEKGRRYMLDRTLAEREKLKNPYEQKQLLRRLPRVILEEIELDPTAADSSESRGSTRSSKLQSSTGDLADSGA